MGFFERYLTIWVLACIALGILLGGLAPQTFASLAAMEYAQINLPVGLLIWLMIIPMLVRIDLRAVRNVTRHARSIGITLFVNWLVKPFSMALLAVLFLQHLFADLLPADRIGEYIEYAPRNAFGDPVQTDLCASNPAVRAYARALARDVASRGVRSVVAEAVQFFPLDHGNHHERYFLPLGPRTKLLMGLCFCDPCIAAARLEGVDGNSLRRWAQSEIERVFDHDVDDPPRELTNAEAAELAGGDVGAYLRMRERIVTTLVAELRSIVAEAGVRLTFLDPSGAIKGYATGLPTGGSSPTIAWTLGVDLAGLATAADDIMILGYAADPTWVSSDIDAYRAILGADAKIVVALRPTAPDSTTVENLRSKVDIAIQAEVSRLDFYHYGLMRMDALDRIRSALGK